MTSPNIKLKGMIRTDNVLLEVTFDGQMTVGPAKAAVAEVFENLKNTDFSKVE